MEWLQLLTANPASVLLASFCAGAIVWLHYHYARKYAFWSSMGVRGPKPLAPFGNLHQLLMGERAHDERRWAQHYGKVYGIYRGQKPHLVVADAQLAYDICIKHFDSFPNHDSFRFSNKYQEHFLITLQDDHWRRVRAMMSPTFTSGKLKRMFKLLDVCANDLVQCFAEQLVERKHLVNLKNIFGLYTLDAIASCAYGLKLERAGASNFKAAALRNQTVSDIVRIFETRYFNMLVLFIVPESLLKLIGWKVTPTSIFEPLAQKVRQIMRSRRESNKKYDDYLQLLLEAKLDDQMEMGEMDEKENHHAALSAAELHSYQRRMIEGAEGKPTKFTEVQLSDAEILSNAIFLLMVGFETTGTLLTNCSYALAFHPEIQEQLYRELKSIAEFDVDKRKFVFEYERLTALPYLDSVICETLRLLTPVLQLDRVSSEHFYIDKYKLQLPKGTKLLLAYHAIMNDPDYWPEPEKFDPTRFMPENRHKIVQGSYCPFGLGPRHCIGMRFSLTEAKLALAKVLMSYKLTPAAGCLYPPKFQWSLVFNCIKEPLVHMETRS